MGKTKDEAGLFPIARTMKANGSQDWASILEKPKGYRYFDSLRNCGGGEIPFQEFSRSKNILNV